METAITDELAPQTADKSPQMAFCCGTCLEPIGSDQRAIMVFGRSMGKSTSIGSKIYCSSECAAAR